MHSPFEGGDGPNLTAALERIAVRSPVKAETIGQYRVVAGKYNELWAEIDQRTELSEWREDGVGSCHSSPHFFDTHVDGVIGNDLEDLWEVASRDHPDTNHRACQFHREDQGCILGSLKSPRCIDHVDGPHYREITERLGIELPDFVAPLRRIQKGGLDSMYGQIDPSVNDQFLQDQIAATQALIDQVKVFPVLHPTEQ